MRPQTAPSPSWNGSSPFFATAVWSCGSSSRTPPVSSRRARGDAAAVLRALDAIEARARPTAEDALTFLRPGNAAVDSNGRGAAEAAGAGFVKTEAAVNRTQGERQMSRRTNLPSAILAVVLIGFTGSQPFAESVKRPGEYASTTFSGQSYDAIWAAAAKAAQEHIKIEKQDKAR